MLTHDDAFTNDPQVANEPRSGDYDDDNFFALLSDRDRAAIWDRLLAPRRRKAPVAAPLSEFDQDFFGAVEPRLQRYVRLGAYLVSLGLESFSAAHARVIRTARKYGALHLSDTAFLQLDSWIDRALLAMIDADPPEGVVGRAFVGRLLQERL